LDSAVQCRTTRPRFRMNIHASCVGYAKCKSTQPRGVACVAAFVILYDSMLNLVKKHEKRAKCLDCGRNCRVRTARTHARLCLFPRCAFVCVCLCGARLVRCAVRAFVRVRVCAVRVCAVRVCAVECHFGILLSQFGPIRSKLSELQEKTETTMKKY